MTIVVIIIGISMDFFSFVLHVKISALVVLFLQMRTYRDISAPGLPL